MTKKKMSAFGYYGGKYIHLDWLLPLLPEKVDIYAEPFAGSLSVLINRPKARVEIANDINENVVNLFEVMRDQGEEFLRQIYLTPYSKSELKRCIEINPKDTCLEKARKFITRINLTINGQAVLSEKGWGYKASTKKGSTRAISWANKPKNLDDVIARIKTVQFDCMDIFDFLTMLKKNADQLPADKGLIYLDPPYVLSTRENQTCYQFEMKEDEHIRMLEICKTFPYSVAISGYKNDLYDSILTDWNRVDIPCKTTSSMKIISKSDERPQRWESLWRNPKCVYEASKEKKRSLFKGL